MRGNKIVTQKHRSVVRSNDEPLSVGNVEFFKKKLTFKSSDDKVDPNQMQKTKPYHR